MVMPLTPLPTATAAATLVAIALCLCLSSKGRFSFFRQCLLRCFASADTEGVSVCVSEGQRERTAKRSRGAKE